MLWVGEGRDLGFVGDEEIMMMALMFEDAIIVFLL